VQVNPIKPKLKPPGTQRLKLNCDAPLSNFAFNFNLRRYIEAYDALFSSDWSPPVNAFTPMSVDTGSPPVPR
jgi:hypothetical protein